MFLARAAAQYGLQVMAFLQEAAKHSSVEQWILSQSCAVGECTEWVYCANAVKCLFGCRNRKFRFARAIRGGGLVARRSLGSSDPAWV